MSIVPKRGDVLYIDASDDRYGGLAMVEDCYLSMSAGKMIPFVNFKGMYGHSYNLAALLKQQPRLRAFFASSIARKDSAIDRQDNPLLDILEPRVFDEAAYHKLEQDNEHLWTGQELGTNSIV